MALFRTKYDKSRVYRVIIYLPEHVALYLNLYALAEGNARTQTVRALVETWYRETSERMTEEMLIDKVITRAEIQWDVIQSVARTKAQYESFDDFLDQLEKELSREKGNVAKIDQSIIHTIIRRLDEKNKSR